MAVKFLIFEVVLCMFLATSGYTQQSAQAVMPVSVTVVKSNQIQAPPAVQLSLSNSIEGNVESEIGKYIITGLNDSDILEFPTSVLLQNEEVDYVRVPLRIEKKLSDNNVSWVSVAAILNTVSKYSLKGKYQGNYKVSVVYP